MACMPTFDIVSTVDMQEVRNAIDQANREAATRFDFKGTDSKIDLVEADKEIVLDSATRDRLSALLQVLEEKLVRRKVSMKALSYGTVEDAAKGRARQRVTLSVGISAEHAKRIGKFLKGLEIKSLASQVVGDQVRVTSKKRDDLQAAITALKAEDFGIPLDFTNFRD